MISIAIQHHPSRAELVQRLLERCPSAELIEDPEPEAEPIAFRTYRECLLRTPADATHRVVIQDDALPCVDFERRAADAIAERPDALIVFFVPGIEGGGSRRVRWAAKDGARWAQIGGLSWVPAVAVSWPVTLIEPFLTFCRQPRWKGRDKADDSMIARFTKAEKMEVWATVPSLVEHPDDVPSLFKKKHGNGRIKWRVAEYFVENP